MYGTEAFFVLLVLITSLQMKWGCVCVGAGQGYGVVAAAANEYALIAAAHSFIHCLSCLLLGWRLALFVGFVCLLVCFVCLFIFMLRALVHGICIAVHHFSVNIRQNTHSKEAAAAAAAIAAPQPCTPELDCAGAFGMMATATAFATTYGSTHHRCGCCCGWNNKASAATASTSTMDTFNTIQSLSYTRHFHVLGTPFSLDHQHCYT